MEALFYMGEDWKVLQCPENARRVGEPLVTLIEGPNPDKPWSVRLGADGRLTLHGLRIEPNVRPHMSHKFRTPEGEELEIEPDYAARKARRKRAR